MGAHYTFYLLSFIMIPHCIDGGQSLYIYIYIYENTMIKKKKKKKTLSAL